MKERIQERGHCQVCGRLQAAKPGMANHGYTVEHGYFHGVCPGASKPALELSREQLDLNMVGLLRWADQLEDRALKVEQREELPETYQERVFVGWGKGKDGYELREMRYDALDDYDRNRKYDYLAVNLRNRAKGARDHAAMMYALAEQVHGQPLVEVKVGDQSKVISVGDRVKVCGGEVEVVRMAVKAARGVGYSINGQHVEHVFWIGADGQERGYPKRYARKVQP